MKTPGPTNELHGTPGEEAYNFTYIYALARYICSSLRDFLLSSKSVIIGQQQQQQHRREIALISIKAKEQKIERLIHLEIEQIMGPEEQEVALRLNVFCPRGALFFTVRKDHRRRRGKSRPINVITIMDGCD